MDRPFNDPRPHEDWPLDERLRYIRYRSKHQHVTVGLLLDEFVRLNERVKALESLDARVKALESRNYLVFEPEVPAPEDRCDVYSRTAGKIMACVEDICKRGFCAHCGGAMGRD